MNALQGQHDAAIADVSATAGHDLVLEASAFDADVVTQLARGLRLSAAAVLVAVCHAVLLRMRPGQDGVVLRVAAPGLEAAQADNALSNPPVSEDDSFRAIAQAVQAELNAIPFRRDVLGGLLLTVCERGVETPQAVPGAVLTLLSLEDEEFLRAQEDHGRLALRVAADFLGTRLDLPELIQGMLHIVHAQPDLPVARLPLWANEADLEMFGHWNATVQPFPRSRRVDALVAQQALATPDHVAVEDDEFFLTYAQLMEEADRLARVLRDRGVGPGSLVGVALQRSWRLPLTLLAIMRTGAAYVPLDPAFPPDRLSFMMADCNAALVLTDEQTRPLLPVFQQPTCLVEELNGPGRDHGPSGYGRLAYVMYTSGSTGQPKGVQVHHDGVLNLLWSMGRLVEFTARDRLLAVSSASFDISVLEIFLPLVMGGTAIIAPRVDVVEGAALARRLARSRATICQATPVTWRMLIEAGWQGQGVKILCGGEAVDPDLARQLVWHGQGRFWNVYGPTETTIWSTAECVTKVEGLHVPVGRPLGNTVTYILDTQGHRVAPGVLGELWIGGVGVADGYLNRPDLTADRFHEDPFATGSSFPRIYRTGDRARYLADGRIEFHGRTDHQVKLRGFRIELGDIEAALTEHPAIRQAVASVMQDQVGEGVLVAYLTGSDPFPDLMTLRAHIRTRLPEYMIPNRFVRLKEFPQTPNGKVDRKRLPMDLPALDEGQDRRAPGNPTETRLIALWRDVLGVDGIGVDDHFLALGGHSLRAVRLLDRVHAEFGVRLHLNTLYFDGATPALMARLLEKTGSRSRPAYVQAFDVPGQEPALFCLHTLGNLGLFHYRALAAHLSPQVKLHGLQAVGLDDGLAPMGRVREMAAHAIQAMRGQQPQGPYRLCGFSSGGLVAYEMACQLQHAGEDVQLFLLDSESPLQRRPWAYLKRFVRNRLRGLAENDPDRLVRKGIPSVLRRKHLLASWFYRPRPYDGRVVLFASTATQTMFRDPALGWSRVSPNLHLVAIDTDHDGVMREPAVSKVAQRLLTELTPDASHMARPAA